MALRRIRPVVVLAAFLVAHPVLAAVPADLDARVEGAMRSHGVA